MAMASARRFSEKWRLAICIACGAVAAAVTAPVSPWQLTVLVAFDVFATVKLVWIWSQIRRCDSVATRDLSQREDDSRNAVRVAIVLAAVASLGGVVRALIEAERLRKVHDHYTWMSATLTIFAVVTVALAWALVHTVFTLRYAHRYYTSPIGGLSFDFDGQDGAHEPTYSDFAYVAFTVGMSFAISDTNTTSTEMRRTMLWHALLSYLFGAVIVGMTINVMASLIG